MTVWTALMLLLALASGIALGWLLRDFVENSARRRTGVVGDEIGALVEPLRAAVGELNQYIDVVERNRTQEYAGLREQVAGMHRTSQLLSTQTGQLVAALRAPQVRGRWGEIQLERVVELAGMTRHCDFDTQVTSGGHRPDMIVRLAGGKQIVVDAKVPFAAYLDAAQAQDPDERDKFLSRHARQLRAHIDQLADKAYWNSFEPTPEFVILFLPGDPFLDAALGADAALLEHAFGRNVILATPTTLTALLRTIALGWRHESLSDEAATIQRLGRELYQRIGAAGHHLDRLGAQLGKAVDAFNHTVASMESRVMVTARKLHDLEQVDGEIREIHQVDSWPRAVGLSDLESDRRHVSDGF
jgi:DNA recombination protein RmuC